MRGCAAILWAVIACRSVSVSVGFTDPLDKSVLLSLFTCYPRDGWDNATDPCVDRWSGVVSCTDASPQRISVLDLSNVALTELPAAFGDLTELSEINLAGNSIRTLPLSFGLLRQLQKLDLSRNVLEMLPDTFGQLGRLRDLDLSENTQLRLLPESFGQLARLQDFMILRANICELPHSFGHLHKLERMSIRDNNLTSLPESFGALESLQWLVLHNNHLLTLPDSFGGLSNLVHLDILDNGLEVLPSSFARLKSLREFRAHGNSLRTLPEWFGNLTQLQQLDLHRNLLTKLPSSFVQLHKLTKLVLDPNVDVCPRLGMMGSGGHGTPFECVCRNGFYDMTKGQVHCLDADTLFSEALMEEARPTNGCAICPHCLLCDSDGVRLQAGYALRHEDPPVLADNHGVSIAVFRCPGNGSNCMSNGDCRTGYQGALCNDCVPSYGMGGSADVCIPCNTTTTVSQNRTATFTFCSLFVVSLVAAMASARIHKIYRFSIEAELFEHGKILVGLFQVLSPMGDVLSVPFARRMPMLHSLVHTFDPLFLSLQDFLMVNCLPALNDFYISWLVNVFALPLVVFIGIGLNYLRVRRDENVDAVGQAQTGCFLTCFCLYPRMSKKIFEIYACRQLSATESWLEVDYGVSCTNGTHSFYASVAAILVLLVTLGLPLIGIIALVVATRRNRAAFDADSGASFAEYNHARLLRHYGLLIRVYRGEIIFYECIDWLRKMLLGGLLLLLHRGSIAQVFCGSCVSFGFFALHVHMKPYRKQPTNIFKACIEAQIFLTILITILLRFEDKYIQTADEALKVSDYEWLVVTTFFLLVPTAFVVASCRTFLDARDQARHVARELKEPLRFSTQEWADAVGEESTGHPEQLTLTVLDGQVPGMLIAARVPSSGQKVTGVIPDGAVPGDKFVVTYTPQKAVAAAMRSPSANLYNS